VTTAVIVQARVGSSRLPGKTLQKIANHTVLEEVLRRCKRIPGADIVVCATSTESADDAIIAPATKAGAEICRGPLNDVLKRYRLAADQVSANVVMRITSDCPLIDPALCGVVLDKRKNTDTQYCANNMPPCFPHGLDCEAFTADVLRDADEKATEPYDREHVTPWLRKNDQIRKSAVTTADRQSMHERWTIDYPEDLDFIRAVFSLFPSPETILPWQEVAALIEARPDILSLNAARAVAR
jgi:spore coat polysaccharide biosynthesis protein SpsF